MEEKVGRACGTLERGEKYLQNYSRQKCMEGKEHEGNSTIVLR
jgi:tRNA splicing ligase